MEKDPDKSPEEKFLGRWSRRKTETAQRPEAGVADAASEPQSGGPLSARRAEDTGDQAEQTQTTEVLSDEHMPPIDSLTEDSDFSGFLSPGVSERLRKQALRKLFSSAGFNIRDGLDDYDDDFRNFAALGDLITSDMKHQMELEEERKRQALEAAETEAETPPQLAEDEAQTDTDAPPDREINADPAPGGDQQGEKGRAGLNPDDSTEPRFSPE